MFQSVHECVVRSTREIVAGATLAFCLMACADGNTDDPFAVDEPTVARVEVTSPVDTLYSPNDTTRMFASAHDASGNFLNVGSFVWESSNTDVVTVDVTGLVAAVGMGSASVTARIDGVEGSASITVDFGPELSSLAFADPELALCIDELGLTYAHQVIQLECAFREITHLAGLEQLRRLEELQLQYNQIADVQPLSSLTKLWSLVIGNNAISDVSPIASLTELRSLWLERNRISDISMLGSLTEVGVLSLSYNALTDISVLSGHQKVWDLRIDGNNFESDDYAVLESLPNLYSLGLADLGIVDVSPFAGLTSVALLGLSQNAINDITPLSGLSKLAGLYLSDNSISDMAQFQQMTGLLYLYLDDNLITDVAPLASLRQLLYLSLRNNSITTGVAALVTLTSAQEIGLQGNPNIACADLDTLVSALGSAVVGVPDTCQP